MKKLTLAPLVLALCQVACGGANGEPLVAGNLTGSYDGRSFTAINGFAAIEDDEEILVFGDGNVHCGSPNASSPPSGMTAAFQVPSFAVGTYDNVFVQMYNNVGSFMGVGSTGGTVTITSSTEETIAGTVSFTYTDAMSRSFSFSGNFEVVNCGP